MACRSDPPTWARSATMCTTAASPAVVATSSGISRSRIRPTSRYTEAAKIGACRRSAHWCNSAPAGESGSRCSARMRNRSACASSPTASASAPAAPACTASLNSSTTMPARRASARVDSPARCATLARCKASACAVGVAGATDVVVLMPPSRPWQSLYRRPLPQAHGASRPGCRANDAGGGGDSAGNRDSHASASSRTRASRVARLAATRAAATSPMAASVCANVR